MEALLTVPQPDARPAAQKGGRRGRQHYVREGREANSLGLTGTGLVARRLRGTVRRHIVIVFWVRRQCFYGL